MVATAANLSDHLLPPLPLRQWVLAVPKRLRYFLHDDALLQGVVVRILLRAVERCLRAHSPGCTGAAGLGAVVFIHRCGSSLNAHRHFHCCILDGVFEPAHAADAAAGVLFHAASALAAAAMATVQAQVRQRVLRAFVRRGLREQHAGDEMGGWAHGGGFSLDAAVRIEGADPPDGPCGRGSAAARETARTGPAPASSRRRCRASRQESRQAHRRRRRTRARSSDRAIGRESAMRLRITMVCPDLVAQTTRRCRPSPMRLCSWTRPKEMSMFPHKLFQHGTRIVAVFEILAALAALAIAVTGSALGAAG